MAYFQELIENPPPYANPVQLVSKAADNIVLKIVNNVCMLLGKMLMILQTKVMFF